MRKNTCRIMMLLAIVSVTIVVYLFSQGFVNKQQGMTDNDYINCRCFYATVERIDDLLITVEGESYNGINYRGKFNFKLTGKEVIEWQNTTIQSSDIKVGNRIAIYFTGTILETSPVKITEVIKLELLDEER